MASGKQRKRPEVTYTGRKLWHRTLRKRIDGFILRRPAELLISTTFLAVWGIVLLCLVMMRMSWTFSDTTIPKAELDAELNIFKGRTFIFCVNPGRAGSKYLQAVLRTAKNVIALHEPRPKMNNETLRSVIVEGKRNKTFLSRSSMKLDAITDVLQGTSEGVHYAETSHMFIKTFADVILEKLGRSNTKLVIIYLHRDVVEVVTSQLHLGWFQDSHSGNQVWYYKLQDVHPSERVIVDSDKFSGDHVDAAIGYNVDILRRQRMLKDHIKKGKRTGKFKNVKEINVYLKDLNPQNEDKSIEKFLKSIGLEPDQERVKLLDQQETNARDFKKSLVQITFSQEQVERRIKALLPEGHHSDY